MKTCFNFSFWGETLKLVFRNCHHEYIATISPFNSCDNVIDDMIRATVLLKPMRFHRYRQHHIRFYSPIYADVKLTPVLVFRIMQTTC